MAKSLQRFYWDSCVFTALLGKEAARFTTLQTFVEDIQSSDGKKKIITSEIAKVEVAFAAYEKRTRQLDATFEQLLDDFWADDSVVELVEFHDSIAKQARKFMRDSIVSGKKVLKPYDAIHLATAEWVGVNEFHTYDVDDYSGVVSLVKFKICEPHVSQPRLTKLDGYL